MPSIGGYSMLTIRGEFQSLGQTVEPITRPNIDGEALRIVGQRGQPFVMRSLVDVDDAAAAETEAGIYKGLQGTLVTIVDDHGQTHTNVAVLAVRVMRKRAVKTAAGGLSTSQGYLVTAIWVLQETNIA